MDWHGRKTPRGGKGSMECQERRVNAIGELNRLVPEDWMHGMLPEE